MNTIKVTTENIKPFELPKAQEWYLIIKSLAMFSEFNAVLSLDDVFKFTKEEDCVYVLLHTSEKIGLTKPLLAFNGPITINQSKLHEFLYESFKKAWAEYLF